MKKKIKCNMTASYNPYANAVAERVNGILKQEFNLDEHDGQIFVMRFLVKNSIKVYSTKRPHLSCQIKIPEQMHKQSGIKNKTYKIKQIEG